MDRLKALFREKEASLKSERDAALESSLAATAECKRLNEQLVKLQGQVASLSSQLKVRSGG